MKGRTLKQARAAIVRAGCRVGRITRRSSKAARPGRVLAQSPGPGNRVRRGFRVNLVLSKAVAKKPAVKAPVFTG